MSYLDSPRLHFSGWFQADVSTINNNTCFYQNESFVPDYQNWDATHNWNPEGTGIFRMLDCVVTGGYLDGRLLSHSSEDAAIGASIQNAIQRTPAKLVDLDPQQQMVSTIWGLQIRLLDAQQRPLLVGEYEPAAFCNLWQRQQVAGAPHDQQLGATYQSVLHQVTWPKDHSSSLSLLLQALQASSEDGLLSINFNVFGYGRDPSIPRYTMGRMVGTIGPYRRGEPHHFLAARQLIAPMKSASQIFVPKQGLYSLQAQLDGAQEHLTLDFGNTFPIETATSHLLDVGVVCVGVLHENPSQILESVKPDAVTLIGEVPYQSPDWFKQTAGVQTFALNAEAKKRIHNRPIVLLTPTGDQQYQVRLQESLNGVYVRADQFVYRLDPGETQTIELYATQWGKPFAHQDISVIPTNGMMGGSGNNDVKPPFNPPVPVPNIGTPAQALQFPAHLTTDVHGRAELPIAAIPEGPGQPRGYLHGQLYGLAYQLTVQPPHYVGNRLNYISILMFDRQTVPEQPTWFQDIQPIFTQYGNLYPIMSRYVVDLSDYDAVVKRLQILRLAFSLPRHDPNHMPVTRDLSADQRTMILKWLDSKGPDGLPLKGQPPVRASAPSSLTSTTTSDAEAPPSSSVPQDALQGAGKTAVILAYQQKLAQETAHEHQSNTQ